MNKVQVNFRTQSEQSHLVCCWPCPWASPALCFVAFRGSSREETRRGSHVTVDCLLCLDYRKKSKNMFVFGEMMITPGVEEVVYCSLGYHNVFSFYLQLGLDGTASIN